MSYNELSLVRSSLINITDKNLLNFFKGECVMLYFGQKSLLYYAVVLAIAAVIIGFLGFGGVAGAFSEIARILFFVFILLFVLSLIAHLVRGGGGGIVK